MCGLDLGFEFVLLCYCGMCGLGLGFVVLGVGCLLCYLILRGCWVGGFLLFVVCCLFVCLDVVLVVVFCLWVRLFLFSFRVGVWDFVVLFFDCIGFNYFV